MFTSFPSLTLLSSPSHRGRWYCRSWLRMVYVGILTQMYVAPCTVCLQTAHGGCHTGMKPGCLAGYTFHLRRVKSLHRASSRYLKKCALGDHSTMSTMAKIYGALYCGIAGRVRVFPPHPASQFIHSLRVYLMYHVT